MMNRFLLIDIGAGTMDVLFYECNTGRHYKTVAKAPVVCLSEKIESIPGNLFLDGGEMGGGQISALLKKRAADAEVVMTRSAAATVHHDPAKVEAFGIRVVADDAADSFHHNERFQTVTLGDLDLVRLQQIVASWGIAFRFDILGICAQDHGIPPRGVSHLDYRHDIFTALLKKKPVPEALLSHTEDLPATFSRLQTIAHDARRLPVDEIYLMDSGMAAVLGASMDPRAAFCSRLFVIDVATSHTVGAALLDREIAGFFEYHTHDLTLARLEQLVAALADGRIDHRQIIREGGHGAYLRKAVGFDALEMIVSTGPKRKLLAETALPVYHGAPLGDHMMTGAVGLLEAIRRRKGWDPIRFL